MAGGGAFFPSGSRRLYGYVHAPAAVPAAYGPAAVVFVHPFMEERQDAHPFLRSLAEAVAAKGLWALRFDLHGCGDSEGEWHEATVATWRDDVGAAVAHARAACGVDRVVLCGLRFGALLAATSEPARECPLALVQPTTKGATYAMDMLRAYLAAEMVLTKRAGVSRDVLVERLRAGETVNVFGYQLTAAQFDGLREADLATALQGRALPTLLVDVVKTETARASNELAAIAAAVGATLARAVEPQPLHAEGKVHLTRAPQVEAAVGSWLDALRPPT